MRILAIEFSSPQRSVAVLNLEGSAPSLIKKDGALTKQCPPKLTEVIETSGRGTNALAMVDQALREAGMEREQIQCLVVGLGPGSYTGIRASIAIAQGWQLARRVKLLGISSVECLVSQARSEGLKGRVTVLIDAQRTEVYAARYEIDAKEPLEVMPLKLLGLNEAQTLVSEGGVLIGPEVTRWFPTGRTLFPRAAMLAELAASRSDYVPGEKLEPIYLRETNFAKAPRPRSVEGNASSLP